MAENIFEEMMFRFKDWWKGILYGAGFFLLVMRETLGFFRKSQVGYKVLVMQILFTGFEALSIIIVLSMSLGAIIMITSYSFGYSLLIGQSGFMYKLLVIILTIELGPILTAFIIIARSGTAIATELGGMVVNHEIEAYLSFGINPISYLVVPRFLGVVISMLLLTVYFNVFGLLGSYLIAASFAPIPFNEYMTNILRELKPQGLAISLGKAAVFGTIISLVSSFQGFAVKQSSTEVPVAGIRAVSLCFVWCIIADALLALIYYTRG